MSDIVIHIVRWLTYESMIVLTELTVVLKLQTSSSALSTWSAVHYYGMSMHSSAVAVISYVVVISFCFVSIILLISKKF